MGPFRESNTKTDLTPVLNEFEYRSMIKQVDPKPVYLIGGIDIGRFLSIQNLEIMALQFAPTYSMELRWIR